MMSLAEALNELRAAGGAARLAGAAGTRFGSVSTDTRTLGSGALFVALRGERYDGHDYLPVARQRGAAAALVERGRAADAELPCIEVDDTRRALARLAAAWRARFDLPLVAVVGSNGKTTVKEMCAAILRARHPAPEAVLATRGNLNNDIGLPLTLLELRPGHAAAVVEIGMNHPGETAELAPLAAPTIGLINNAQREHQEFMRSVEEVAREHAALLDAVRAGGTAVINADDAHAPLWREAARRRGLAVLDFGLDAPAAVSAEVMPAEDGMALALRAPGGTARVELAAWGRHNARNALAAAAAALAAGAEPQHVVRGLAAFRPVRGRLQRKPGIHGAAVYDDTYNANPDSVRAAIDVLAAAGGRRVLVLGDMGEVGEQGAAFHAEIGAYARERGVELLLATGELARHAVAAFGAGARHFDSVEALTDAARALAAEGRGASMLVKGSRFMRMERVVDRLTEDAAHAA